MAGVRGGMSEIVLLCVADYLTSEIVMNVFIRPTIPVIDWRTTFSGVTPAAMAAATAQGQTLNGWREARRELWNHIDVDTILVGQSLQHDLDVLRMIHTRVVDSAIMARKAVDPKSTRQWGLKTLCNELLGIDIQSNGRTGHDCLEDALAAREVVLWCIQRPRQLKTWGRLWKEKEKAQKQERKLEKEKRKRLMQNSEESKSRVGDTYIGHYSNGNEVLHWSDIAEDCGWPHPDTGYDDSEVQHWSDIAEDCGWPHPDTGYDPWSD
ncbi:hypothetical protein MMC08_003249 [Hypocenomyce scalaris]|nr:hypothetical protein [Hypocenomyce scalaris]